MNNFMKTFFSLLCMLFLLATSIPAFATTTPIQNGPFYLDFLNWENFSDPQYWNSENDQNTEAPIEDNWGMIVVNRYNLGSGSGTGIGDSGQFPNTWARGDGDIELTGLFYGIDIVDFDAATSDLEAIGGSLDIYANPIGTLGDSSQDLASTYDPNTRTIDNITGGDLWLSVDFVPGVAQGPGGELYTVTATSLDNTDPLAGASQSYFKVTGGSMQDYFINDYFDMPFGDNTAAFLSKNSFDPATPGSGYGFSTMSEDPVIGYGVPEPTTLLLFGTGLLGLAAFGRKKFMKKS